MNRKRPVLVDEARPTTFEVEAINERGETIPTPIAGEHPLTLYLDKRELLTLMTLGAAPGHLALGYLRNQRILRSIDEIASVQVDWETGSVAVTSRSLAERGVGDLRFTGMACDGMVDVAARGLLDLRARDGYPPVAAVDCLGTRALMEWVDDNPSVGVYPSTIIHDPVALAHNGLGLAREHFPAFGNRGPVSDHGGTAEKRTAQRIGGKAAFEHRMELDRLVHEVEEARGRRAGARPPIVIGSGQALPECICHVRPVYGFV